jgi:transposase
VEIYKQIFAVYGNIMNRQNVTKWCREFSEERTDVHDEQRSDRPSLISEEAGQAMLKNKVMYWQFIHSVAFVN